MVMHRHNHHARFPAAASTSTSTGSTPLLRNVTLDGTDPAIIYSSGWQETKTDAGSGSGSGLSMHTSSDDNATATLVFRGVAVYIVAPHLASTIDATVTLDGQGPFTLSFDAADSDTEVVWGTTGLSDTQHTLVVSKSPGARLVGLDSIIYTTAQNASDSVSVHPVSSTLIAANRVHSAVSSSSSSSSSTSSSASSPLSSSTAALPLPTANANIHNDTVPINAAPNPNPSSSSSSSLASSSNSLPSNPNPNSTAAQNRRTLIVAIGCAGAVLLLVCACIVAFLYRRHAKVARKREWARKYALQKPLRRGGGRDPEPAETRPPSPVVPAWQGYPRPPQQYALARTYTPTHTPTSSTPFRDDSWSLPPSASPTLPPSFSIPLTGANTMLLPPSPSPSALLTPPATSNPFASLPPSPSPSPSPYTYLGTSTPLPPASPWSITKSESESESRRLSGSESSVRSLGSTVGYGWTGPSLVGIHPFSAMAREQEEEEEEERDVHMPLPSETASASASASSSRDTSTGTSTSRSRPHARTRTRTTFTPALNEKAALAALERTREEAEGQQGEDSNGVVVRPMSAAPAYREKDAAQAFARQRPGREDGQGSRALMSVASEVTLAPPVYEP
ncbi:hypothetical protein C8F01DRAFT_1375076 [Mycena amicta]|nr:hypothetical protein C8F01DRAFT_1375076 [Mycena amicta]